MRNVIITIRQISQEANGGIGCWDWQLDWLGVRNLPQRSSGTALSVDVALERVGSEYQMLERQDESRRGGTPNVRPLGSNNAG